jgi:hypothetical protein
MSSFGSETEDNKIPLLMINNLEHLLIIAFFFLIHRELLMPIGDYSESAACIQSLLVQTHEFFIM